MTLYFSFLFSLTRIMMPYTPEYNIKWVLNVEIRFPAVIRDPFDRENGDVDMRCTTCTSTETSSLGIRTGISQFLSAESIATSAEPHARVAFS
jgi:hypothetical protein